MPISVHSPRRIALVVNAFYSGELTSTTYDVTRMYSLLTSPELGVCDNNASKKILECKTRNEFYDTLSPLLGGWRVTDQLIFYFSGHGTIRRGYFCLKLGNSDSDLLPFNNLMNDLDAAGVQRAILILDACHSGKALDRKDVSNEFATINEAAIPKGIAILASSHASEISHELPDGSASVYTDLLCRGIETGLGGQPTQDGLITVGDIVHYISNELHSDEKFAEYRQRPVFSCHEADREIWIARNPTGAIPIIQSPGKLEQVQRKLREAREVYGHNRFWQPLWKNRDIHIFTCVYDSLLTQGDSHIVGELTNIDIWDHRTVLDITYFLATEYPGAKITIEDPLGKLRASDLTNLPILARRIADMQMMLENKDCIIVGAPDVIDFAELVLAQTHHVAPYDKSRAKNIGFVIIKDHDCIDSSFCWKKEEQEPEGIAQILGVNRYEYFPHVCAGEHGTPGKLYGILVVVNNPFSRGGEPHKIIILAGFDSMATAAIAKILTDNEHLDQFFKLDDEYENISQNIEALISVEYVIDKNNSKRNARRIKNITFERLVEI